MLNISFFSQPNKHFFLDSFDVNRLRFFSKITLLLSASWWHCSDDPIIDMRTVKEPIWFRWSGQTETWWGEPTTFPSFTMGTWLWSYHLAENNITFQKDVRLLTSKQGSHRKILKKSEIRYFLRPWKRRELADNVRKGWEMVEKSGKCREFHVFEGVENISQFKNKRRDIWLQTEPNCFKKTCPLVSNILKYSL